MKPTNDNDTASRRRRRSREEWADEITRWRGSGLSAAKYAAQNEISAGSLFVWARELRKRDLPVSSPRPIAFHPVRVRDEAPARDSNFDVEVTLCNGRKLRVHGDVDGARLARLARALEGSEL